MNIRIIKILLIIAISILITGCGVSIAKNIKQGYDGWGIEIVDLKDEIKNLAMGGSNFIAPKKGYKLAQLKISITNTNNISRTINLEEIRLKTTTDLASPYHIRGTFVTVANKTPELSAKEEITRLLIYSVPEQSSIEAVVLPDSSEINIK